VTELSAAERDPDLGVEKVPWYRARRSFPGESYNNATLFHEVVYETVSRVVVACGRDLIRDERTECYWEKYPGHWPEEQTCRDCLTIVRSRRHPGDEPERLPDCTCSAAVLATGEHDGRCPSGEDDPSA
jgi:hypothetical protein